MGAVMYVVRKDSIDIMEIHAHVPRTAIRGGEPLCVMWARGKQRLLPGGAGFVDISEAKNPVVLNKGVTSSSFASCTYSTKLKKWIMMVTAAQPLPMEVPEYPHGQYDQELRHTILADTGLRRTP